MARISKGNDLLLPVLQPGWTVHEDGYGLWTGRCVFKYDYTKATEPATFDRGVAHPDSHFSEFMFSNTATVSYDRNGIATVTVDYVGVFNRTEGAETNITEPNVSGAVTTVSESIETHPNFFVATTSLNPIAGVGTGSATLPMYTPTTLRVNGNDNYPLYEGNNGACFSQITGGKFVGFLNPEYKYFYGRKSYLAPQTGFSGFIYVATASEDTTVQSFMSCVGRSSNDNTWYGTLPKLLPDYIGDSFTGPAGPALLLASVNFEDFGKNVVKINYTIRYSSEGFNEDVYPSPPSP